MCGNRRNKNKKWIKLVKFDFVEYIQNYEKMLCLNQLKADI